MFKAEIIEDSISEAGVRLTTMQLVYPRMAHQEFLTHRVFSRNASSTRAIPVAKAADLALSEMVEPIRYGKNQKGMQASEENLTGPELERAREIWRYMAEVCTAGAKELAELGLHKQWAGRPLEWFSNIRVIVTSTDWLNWDELRYHGDAMPEIFELAKLMQHVRNNSQPKLLKIGEWHLPYVSDKERAVYPVHILKKLSTARCARVSYLTHQGKEPSIDEDCQLYERLVGSRPLHASPTEHSATPFADPNERSGNFKGWFQHRKEVEKSIWNQ